MYKRVIMISLFFNINLLFASEQTSQNSQKSFDLIKLETEVFRLNSENIELRNNIFFLNNYVLALMKAQNDLLTLVKNNFNQQANQKDILTTQNTAINTAHTNPSIASINTTKKPLIRRSSFTSASTNPQ